MKKLFLLFILFFSTILLWGENTAQFSNGLLTGFCITDSLINKSTTWNLTKKWLATNMDSKQARIVFENAKDGSIIIKGRYKDTNNSLYCVKYGAIIPYISYELEINISNGSYCAKYNKIAYEPVISYGDIPYNLKIILDRIINEMEEIKKITLDKGESWIIDNDFIKKGEKLKSQIDEAKFKMNDKSLSKKERNQYKIFYEKNIGRDVVYHAARIASHRLVFDTLLLDNNLESIIKSSIVKTSN